MVVTERSHNYRLVKTIPLLQSRRQHFCFTFRHCTRVSQMKVSQCEYMTNRALYLKVVSINIETFVPLRNEPRDSRLIKLLGLLLQIVCNCLLHGVVRHESGTLEMFFQFPENVKVAWRQIWAVWRMLKRFPLELCQFFLNLMSDVGTGIVV